MTRESSNEPVLVAGGGIGGLAAALALVRRGSGRGSRPRSADGAGISPPTPLPSTPWVWARARGRAVYTDYMVCTTRWTVSGRQIPTAGLPPALPNPTR
jgi:salicylate hydroxylase